MDQERARSTVLVYTLAIALFAISMTMTLNVFYLSKGRADVGKRSTRDAVVLEHPVLHLRLSGELSRVLLDASPAAAAYQEGMRRMNGFWFTRDVDAAEKLFMQAAVGNLPQGFYGTACVIYRKHDNERQQQAVNDMMYAANHDVLGAKAAVVSYYANGYDLEPDLYKAHLALIDLLNSASRERVGMATPFSKQGEKVILALLNRGNCAPAVDATTLATNPADLRHSLDLLFYDDNTREIQ